MNIQIFGRVKCFNTKKAERYFKERGIKYQFIDMKAKGMSKGELLSVLKALGGYDNILDNNTKDKETLILFKHIAEEDKLDKLIENQQIILTPIVRNSKFATVGYQPDIWGKWE